MKHSVVRHLIKLLFCIANSYWHMKWLNELIENNVLTVEILSSISVVLSDRQVYSPWKLEHV